MVRYVNPVDGYTPMFSVSLLVPHTGHVVEVISDDLDASWRQDFAPWADDDAAGVALDSTTNGGDAAANAQGGDSSASDDPTCAAAMHVGFSAAEMRRNFNNRGGRKNGARGLPDLLLVKASVATDDARALLSFFEKVDVGAKLEFNQSISASAAAGGSSTDSAAYADDAAAIAAGASPAAPTCEWASARIKLGTTGGQSSDKGPIDVHVRAVRSPSSRVGSMSVDDHEARSPPRRTL